MERIVMIILVTAFVAGCGANKAQVAESLRINELMGYNASKFKDEDKEYDDWLEIYNAADSAVNMAGMYFSDNPKKPKKWKVPADKMGRTTVPGKGRLVFWFDKDEKQGPHHADLKISAGGGWVGLYASDGETLVDSVRFGRMYRNITWGRLPGDPETWTYMRRYTPGEPNITVKLEGVAERPKFSQESGFYEGVIQVELEGEGPIYYSVNGRRPDSSRGILYTGPITIDSTTVIRAKSFRKGYLPSLVTTHTFLIDERNFGLPVVSVTADPSHLYGGRRGIFLDHNNQTKREYPAHVTFFDSTRVLGFEQDLGIKLQGR
ncbi:MAG: chitobiase/beta-hexosaminidase C-terminal domain-containing protein, partial [Bacteroidota bacterium]